MAKPRRREQVSKRARAYDQMFNSRAVQKNRGNSWYALLGGGVPLPSGTCQSRKNRYVSQSDAEKVLRATQRSRAAAGATLMEKRVYECSWCQGWHTTKLAEWKGDCP